MHLLKTLYNIEEKNGRFDTLLSEPFDKYFSVDFNNIDKEDNLNSSVFWNFGDPDGGELNEVVTPSIVGSTIKYTYTNVGRYFVNAIVNNNGVLFHIEKDVVLGDNEVNIIPSSSESTLDINVDFKTFYNTDKIYYTIEEGLINNNPPLVGTLPTSGATLYNKAISIPLTTDAGTEKYYTINYCAFTAEGNLLAMNVQYHTMTYHINKL